MLTAFSGQLVIWNYTCKYPGTFETNVGNILAFSPEFRASFHARVLREQTDRRLDLNFKVEQLLNFHNEVLTKVSTSILASEEDNRT